MNIHMGIVYYALLHRVTDCTRDCKRDFNTQFTLDLMTNPHIMRPDVGKFEISKYLYFIKLGSNPFTNFHDYRVELIKTRKMREVGQKIVVENTVLFFIYRGTYYGWQKFENLNESSEKQKVDWKGFKIGITIIQNLPKYVSKSFGQLNIIDLE